MPLFEYGDPAAAAVIFNLRTLSSAPPRCAGTAKRRFFPSSGAGTSHVRDPDRPTVSAATCKAGRVGDAALGKLRQKGQLAVDCGQVGMALKL